MAPQNSISFWVRFSGLLAISSIQAVSTIPLLISALVALGRYNYQDSSAETTALDPRSIVQAVLVPKKFSTFGLQHPQTPARRTVLSMLFLRVVCGLVLLAMMQGIDCIVSKYACRCSEWKSSKRTLTCRRRGPELYRDVGDGNPETLDSLHSSHVILDDHDVCYGEELSFRDLIHTDSDEGELIGHWVLPRFCHLRTDLPAMLREPCRREALDIYRFRVCLDGLPSFFHGVCHGRFTICAAFTDPMTLEKLRVVIYIFLPMCALWALLVAHILAQMLNCSLMDVEENRTLRRQVNQKTRVYLEQLQNGHLQYSVLRLGIRCNHLFPEKMVSYGLVKGTRLLWRL